jgi:DNA-binding transcriptional LysR family regulator
MDIHRLRVFIDVVHHGSFAAAARHLDMAPSMVTRSVAALERELGVRLMQRTTRRLSLTEAGAAYHERVRGVLEGLDRAGDEARATTGDVTGLVRMTSSVSFGQTVLVPLLPALRERHPSLRLELNLTDTMLDLVAERVDLAVRLGPAQDSSLVGHRLVPIRYRVCASPAYVAQQGRPRQPADLAHRDCLRQPLPGFRTQWKFRSADAALQLVDVDGWLVLSNALALHRAALDGLGPSLLADWLVDADLAAGRLVDLFPHHEVTAANFDAAVWLLYASRDYMPRGVRAVVEFLKQRIEATPAPERVLACKESTATSLLPHAHSA